MKFLGSLIAAAALALSMLVAVPTAATAAPSPYPGTVATRASYAVPFTVRKKRSVIVAYRVRAVASNARPAGLVSFYVYKIVKKRQKIRFQLVRVLRNNYVGDVIRLKSLGKFKKGRYATRFAFSPPRNSVFKSSASGLRSFRVRR